LAPEIPEAVGVDVVDLQRMGIGKRPAGTAGRERAA